MRKLTGPGIGMLLLVLNLSAYAQELPAPDPFIKLPSKFISKTSYKISAINDGLNKRSVKYLEKLARQESRLRRKLARIDTTAAKKIAATTSLGYGKLIDKMKDPGITTESLGGEYLPYFDSLNSSLAFLEKNKEWVQQGKKLSDKLNKSITDIGQLQSRLQQADQIKQYIRERKQQLNEALSKYTNLPRGISKSFQQFNRQAYYYSQQVREYKEILNDPDKITQKALSLVNKIPAFRDFIKQHSQLAGLFGLPAGYGNVANLGGLQTRAQVQSLVQNQLASAGGNGQQMLQQNLQAAQTQLNQFKDKLQKLGGGSGDMEMPDFKSTGQRTKTFLQRLEVGTNLQSTPSNLFFPTTTDLGLSLGYRLSDKTVIGIGGSYKVGWGRDMRNIVVTSQGAGLRSFLDIKIKGSFYASGGFEYNYQPLDTSGLVPSGNWTKSGLVGVSKMISLKSKFFKRTKLQLLWDFMSYGQLPRTPALKFRIGYNF